MRTDRLLEPAGASIVLRNISDWPNWLANETPDECRKLLQRNARLGLPCGSNAFIEKLGRIAGRDLRYRPRGGQRKDNEK
jgi:hypothetical protein